MATLKISRAWQVSWLDAWHDCRPHIGLEDIGPEPLRTSVGFLVKEDEKYIYLAATLDSDGLVGQVLKIPRGCIGGMSPLYACGG